MSRRNRVAAGFTIPELLVVMGIIVVLLGLLFPALGAFRRTGLMTKSMANMRQIGAWLQLYAGDNRDHVVPSQFNYIENSYRGKPRSLITEGTAALGEPHRGTWTDILWTVFEIGRYPEAASEAGHEYRYDSPDAKLYEIMAGSVQNPLRSAADNSRHTPGASAAAKPTPFGCGAAEAGLPGFFAANNFFNADPEAADDTDCEWPVPEDRWYTMSQIRAPERSMYLVDSFAGEVIQPDPGPFLVEPAALGGGGGPAGERTAEVDFRYAGQCLMLFLDGHVDPVEPWGEICDLEGSGGRGIRIRELTSRGIATDCQQTGP